MLHTEEKNLQLVVVSGVVFRPLKPLIKWAVAKAEDYRKRGWGAGRDAGQTEGLCWYLGESANVRVNPESRKARACASDLQPSPAQKGGGDLALCVSILCKSVLLQAAPCLWQSVCPAVSASCVCLCVFFRKKRIKVVSLQRLRKPERP